MISTERSNSLYVHRTRTSMLHKKNMWAWLTGEDEGDDSQDTAAAPGHNARENDSTNIAGHNFSSLYHRQCLRLCRHDCGRWSVRRRTVSRVRLLCRRIRLLCWVRRLVVHWWQLTLLLCWVRRLVVHWWRLTLLFLAVFHWCRRIYRVV